MKRIISQTLIAAFLTILLLVVSVPSSKASEAPQPQWSKTYGAWQAFSVAQTVDGGYIVGGAKATYTLRGYTNVTTVLIKIDSSGELQWEKTYGDELGASGGANSVVQTEDLGYALCGSGWLLKTDSQGNVQWNKTFEPSESRRAIQTSDGGYAIVGLELTSDLGQEVPLLLKTDASGNLIWNKTFSPGSSIARVYDVVEVENTNYVVAGTWGGDFWLAKIDNVGNLLLNQTHRYVSSRRLGPLTFRSVAITADGGYILSGDDVGSAWLVKVNSTGEERWNFNFIGGESVSVFDSAVELANGEYIMAGYDDSRALLVKTDTLGNYLWNATYGEKQPDRAFSVIATKDEGFAVAGSLDNNIWLAKFAPEPATSANDEFPQFSTILIAVAVVVIAVFVVSLLVYYRKRNHKSIVKERNIT